MGQKDRKSTKISKDIILSRNYSSLRERRFFRFIENNAATDLRNLTAEAEAYGLANMRSDSRNILDVKEILTDLNTKLKTVEEGWADRIIKVQGSKLHSSLNKYAEKKLAKATDQVALQAETDLIELAGEMENRVVNAEMEMVSIIAGDKASIENAADRSVI